jgi:hypothetical protein
MGVTKAIHADAACLESNSGQRVLAIAIELTICFQPLLLCKNIAPRVLLEADRRRRSTSQINRSFEAPDLH